MKKKDVSVQEDDLEQEEDEEEDDDISNKRSWDQMIKKIC